MNLKEQVDKYLNTNYLEIERLRKSGNLKWLDIAINIDNIIKSGTPAQDAHKESDYIRHRFSRIRKRREKEPTAFCNSQFTETSTASGKFHYVSGKQDSTSKEFTFTADNIPEESEIIEHFKIDTNKYRINQIYHKTSFGGKYAITVSLLALKGHEATDYKEAFKKFVDSYNVKILNGQNFPKVKKETTREALYVCTLSDLHIGNEQKEGYIDRIKQRVCETFNGIAGSSVERVLILNTGDMIHCNNSKNTTANGTQLDPHETFENAFSQALDLTTHIIDYAASLALHVTFVNVRGNHSFDIEYCLGEALKKIYKTNNNIEILNKKDTRIYYYWKNNAFLFTHGDRGMERLPLTFATEGKDVFNKAENHHIILGHLHTNKGKQFVNDRGEFSGIEVRVCGSPTTTDRWHKSEAFTGNKKSLVSFLYTPEEGKYAEFNFKLFK